MNIFILLPSSHEYIDIYIAAKQAAFETGNTISRAEHFEITSAITANIITAISESDLIIADVSDKSPNIMYELGLAQSLKKPIIPISRKGETIPFDIANFRVLIYERERLNETLVTPLRNFLAHSSIEDFIQIEIKDYQKKKSKTKTVFVSYSHVDNLFLNRLKVHMKPFEKSGQIDLWSDTKIEAGEKWKDKIKEALDKSVVAILLISADFLASDFIVDNELPPLLKSAEENGTAILPVILKPCRFTNNDNLSKFQAINDPRLPLSKMNENDREEVYVKVADFIDSLLRGS